MAIQRQYDLNSEQDWEAFATTQYINRNYKHLESADKVVADCVIGILRTLPQGWAELGRDVGSGGTLRAAALVAPIIATRGSFEFSDIGQNQLAQTERARQAATQGDLGYWRIHEAAMAATDPNWSGATQKVCSLGHVARRSVFELPKHSTQLSTAGHCIESITGSPKEFDDAFGCWAESVVPGGILVMLYMICSTGYELDDITFPATFIDPDTVRNTARRYGLAVLGPDIAIQSTGREHIRSPDASTTYWGIGAAVMQKGTNTPTVIL